jgi:ABC-type Fe3+ transport system permease subunit
MYRPAPWWKRVWAAVSGTALALLLGAVLATLIGFGAAWLVITLTDMLKK